MNEDKPEMLDERMIIPITKTLISKIDDYRYSRRIPTRAEAVRRLIEAQLEVEMSDDGDANDE